MEGVLVKNFIGFKRKKFQNKDLNKFLTESEVWKWAIQTWCDSAWCHQNLELVWQHVMSSEPRAGVTARDVIET